MAKAPRIRKQTETVRSKADKAASGNKKPRRIRNTAGKAATPFRVVGRFIKKILSPFGFLLRPFKTRPVRFIGRVIAKILFLGYFRGAWQEVRQVTWPNRKETRQLTTAVFLFALVFSLLITVIDYGLDKLFKKLLLS